MNSVSSLLVITLMGLSAASGCDDDDAISAPTSTVASNGTSGGASNRGPEVNDGGVSDSSSPGTSGEPTPSLSCGGLLGISTCDPVTAWPCDVAAGETCDFSNLAGAFTCHAFATSVPLCGFCDREGEFCGPGTTCGGSRCERYCCTDDDCNSGPCLPDLFGQSALASVGYCPEDSIASCGPNPAIPYDYDAGVEAADATGSN
jgi:hypothetical protein